MGRIPIMVYIVKGNVLPSPPVEADGEALPAAILSPIKGVSASSATTRTAAKNGAFPGGKRLTRQWTGVIGKL